MVNPLYKSRFGGVGYRGVYGGSNFSDIQQFTNEVRQLDQAGRAVNSLMNTGQRLLGNGTGFLGGIFGVFGGGSPHYHNNGRGVRYGGYLDRGYVQAYPDQWFMGQALPRTAPHYVREPAADYFQPPMTLRPQAVGFGPSAARELAGMYELTPGEAANMRKALKATGALAQAKGDLWQAASILAAKNGVDLGDVEKGSAFVGNMIKFGSTLPKDPKGATKPKQPGTATDEQKPGQQPEATGQAKGFGGVTPPPTLAEKQIIDLQQALKSAGYDLGSYGQKKDGLDGKYGPKTHAALAAAVADVNKTLPEGKNLDPAKIDFSKENPDLRTLLDHLKSRAEQQGANPAANVQPAPSSAAVTARDQAVLHQAFQYMAEHTKAENGKTVAQNAIDTIAGMRADREVNLLSPEMRAKLGPEVVKGFEAILYKQDPANPENNGTLSRVELVGILNLEAGKHLATIGNKQELDAVLGQLGITRDGNKYVVQNVESPKPEPSNIPNRKTHDPQERNL